MNQQITPRPTNPLPRLAAVHSLRWNYRNHWSALAHPASAKLRLTHPASHHNTDVTMQNSVHASPASPEATSGRQFLLPVTIVLVLS
jgi:hypothetical protein